MKNFEESAAGEVISHPNIFSGRRCSRIAYRI